MSINIYNGMNSIKILIYEIVKEVLSHQDLTQKKSNNAIYSRFSLKNKKTVKIRHNKHKNYLNKEEKSSQKK